MADLRVGWLPIRLTTDADRTIRLVDLDTLIAGTTWTAVLGDDPLTVSVDGDDVLVTFPADDDGLWVLSLDGEEVMRGEVDLSERGTTNPDAEVTVTLKESSVTVQVIGSVTGPPGTSGGSYVHDQATASAVWTIPHNLGYYPAGIVVIDSGGTEWIGAPTYPDINTLVITFTTPFGGTAYIS